MRRDTWRQDTPVKQYVSLAAAAAGNVSNAQEGINVEVSLERAARFLEELHDLRPYLERDPHRWIED